MKQKKLLYPAARKSDVADDYHGTSVADPYRWLEDPEAEETQTWVAAQNALTRQALDAIPERDAIEKRLTELWDFPKYAVPRSRRAGREVTRYFWEKNEGLQNQPVLYRQDGPDAEPAVVLDPNRLSEDGTIALVNYAVSEDGRLLAYGLSSGGSDWQEIHIQDVDGHREYDEVLQWIKFAPPAWKHDNSGFFYSRYPEPGAMPDAPPSTHHRVYWHALGTPQAEDTLVYGRPDDLDLIFMPTVSDDGRYLLLWAGRGTAVENRIYYRPVDDAGDFIPLFVEEDAKYTFAGNVGDRFYFLTDRDAPRGRVVAVDLAHPEPEAWQEIIPEGEDVVDHVRLVHDQLIVVTMHHAAHRVHRYTLAGDRLGEISLPDTGTIVALSGRRQDDELFLHFHSFLYPPSVFRYDFAADALQPWRVPQLDFDAADYETRQGFYTSGDGTRVPMFLIHRHGLEKDSNNPTLLYGYGGFAVNVMPAFAVSWLVWLERGCIVAVANLRGGNEYGEAWHQAGMLANKQNVFDDFIAAAEWLIANDYTKAEKLAITGGSNGGLLVTAAMLQRPDLFGAVVARVPVTDMLRYHRFTAGRYWVPEYGNAETDPDHFRFLYAYSPLHNVRPGARYPPLLITSADTDDRVVPMHAKKLAATLQAQADGDKPVLLRVETRAGHGLGKPTAKIIDELADVYAFLVATVME